MKLLLPKTTLILLAALFCASADLSASAGAASTATGTVSGSISGLPPIPKKAGRHLTVRIVNLQSGRIESVLKLKSKKFSVKLPANVFVSRTDRRLLANLSFGSL